MVSGRRDIIIRQPSVHRRTLQGENVMRSLKSLVGHNVRVTVRYNTSRRFRRQNTSGIVIR